MQNNKTSYCPLCANSGTVFYEFKKRLYFQCTNCAGIFMDENLRPDASQEKMRYQEHINDVEDKGFKKFVSPITSAILNNFSATDKGLDFGAGTGPVISKMLNDNGFSIVQYDPFFHNYPDLLNDKYHFIACCEVMEHFYYPKKEFELLRSLLQPGGKLFCMTDLWNKNIDFHKWYYKNDQTHVFIYTIETIEWLKQNIGFSDITIEGRLITFCI
ncbi:MAG: class I SAM-dependent methyltransferase [Bacteroidetes bacterium]|nr:class I SAM-dependent methyltransferase [Bacteroidota bacterium]